MDAASPAESAMSEETLAARIAELNDELQMDLAIYKSLRDVQPNEEIRQQIAATGARIIQSRQELRALQDSGMFCFHFLCMLAGLH
jgi:hypothetical protein